MMKINSGIFRNSSIEILKNSSFRPTTSICRKSFFDTIGSLSEKSFLDIFAGSGIIGFEAASRGAKNVTFVEMNKRYLNKIISNSKNFDYDQFNFMARDAHRYIKKSENFDIIFADPSITLSSPNPNEHANQTKKRLPSRILTDISARYNALYKS